MDREKSLRKDQASSNWENNHNTTPQNELKDLKKTQLVSTKDLSSLNCHNNYQITLFQEGFWLWSKQSYWFYFNQGFVWGIIIAFTAMISAIFGAATTKVEVVENTIAEVIKSKYPTTAPESKYGLTHPVNILLVEVKPNQNEIIEFSEAYIGKIKTVLLLQLDPDSDTVNLINIPNDSRVKIPRIGWGTIEDAYKYGGTPLVSQVIVQLSDHLSVDRYVRGTPAIFQDIMASGKITLNSCNDRIRNCSDLSKQNLRLQTATETIRQRLNIPAYLNSFETTITTVKSDLDTNLSLPEFMSIANFVKELKSDDIQINLVSDYVAGRNIGLDDQLQKSERAFNSSASNLSSLPNRDQGSLNKNFSLLNHPVAVQNTTDSPELGMRLVSYLRSQNFQDVYLIEHIPLKLDKTRIITNHSQLTRAKHLKDTIGFGQLEQKSRSQQKPITIQIGKDANYFPMINRTP